MIKKKMPFIQLTMFFGVITLLTIFFVWGNYKGANSPTMMGQSMGNMMSNMHLNNISVGDFIKQKEQVEISNIADDVTNHHSGEEGILKTLHYFTTGTIVVLLPFILAGTIFLAIIWTGNQRR